MSVGLRGRGQQQKHQFCALDYDTLLPSHGDLFYKPVRWMLDLVNGALLLVLPEGGAATYVITTGLQFDPSWFPTTSFSNLTAGIGKGSKELI